MRDSKPLFLLELSVKYRFLTSLQKEGKSNPALSVFFYPPLKRLVKRLLYLHVMDKGKSPSFEVDKTGIGTAATIWPEYL